MRKQYIGQGELMAGPLALDVLADRLRGRSVIWFIDNVSAGAALIKGSSPVGDSSAMANLASAEAGLGGVLGRLMAVAEAYPDLKANQNMMAVQEELTSTENSQRPASQSTDNRPG